MTSDLPSLATDVATYVAAVSAGISTNALTSVAKSLIEQVVKKLPQRRHDGLPSVTPELIAAVGKILEQDPKLLNLASEVMGHTRIDRSIFIQAKNVSGVTQTNF
jgi:hypothetical protein